MLSCSQTTRAGEVPSWILHFWLCWLQCVHHRHHCVRCANRQRDCARLYGDGPVSTQESGVTSRIHKWRIQPAHTHTQKHTHTQTQTQHTKTHTNTHNTKTHAHARVHTHAHTSTDTHTHTNRHTHTHTHTHTHQKYLEQGRQEEPRDQSQQRQSADTTWFSFSHFDCCSESPQ